MKLFDVVRKAAFAIGLMGAAILGPAPAWAQAAVEPAAAEEGPTNSLPPVLSFVAVNDPLTVVNASWVFLAPNSAAPRAYALQPGTMVQVIARSTDGVWGWVATVNGVAAYVPMSALAPAQ